MLDFSKFDLNRNPQSGIEVWIGNEETGEGTYIGLPNDQMWDIVHYITHNGKGDWYIGDIDNNTEIKFINDLDNLDELNQIAKILESGLSDYEIMVANFRYENESISLVETLKDIEEGNIEYQVFEDIWSFISDYASNLTPDEFLYQLSGYFGTTQMGDFLDREFLYDEEELDELSYDDKLTYVIDFDIPIDKIVSAANSYFSGDKVYDMVEDYQKNDWYIQRNSDGTIIMYM